MGYPQRMENGNDREKVREISEVGTGKPTAPTGAKRHGKKSLSSTAVIILTILIGVGIWLALDAGASAAIRAWIGGSSENGGLFQNLGGQSGAAPEYEPGWLPDGYEMKSSESVLNSIAVKTYAKGEEELSFVYFEVRGDNGQEMNFGDRTVTKSVSVNGRPADLYEERDEGDRTLVWFDEQGNHCFNIQSVEPEEVLIRIAESVRLKEQ